MKELTKVWFEDLFRDEIEEVEANIENNKIWLKGASTHEEAQQTRETIEALEEYLETLKDFQKQIEEA